jgi:hypothetical protein
VIGVHFAIEKIDTGNFHRCNDGVNFGGVTAFGKIRNTFNQSDRHGKRIKSISADEQVASRKAYPLMPSAINAPLALCTRGCIDDHAVLVV